MLPESYLRNRTSQHEVSYQVHQVSAGITVEFNIVKVLYKYLCIKVLQEPVFSSLNLPNKIH